MTDNDCTFKETLAISPPLLKALGFYDSAYLCEWGHVINKSLNTQVLHKQITCSALISSTHDFSIKTIPLSVAPSRPRARG